MCFLRLVEIRNLEWASVDQTATLAALCFFWRLWRRTLFLAVPG